MKETGFELKAETKKEITRVLADYNKFSMQSWDVRDSEQKEKEKLNELVKPLSRKFSLRVRKILNAARPEWSLDTAEMSVVIQHNIQPLQYYVSADVNLFFYADWRRGELRLSSSLDTVDLLLEELERTVCSAPEGEL